MYPDDCLQALFPNNWWIEDENHDYNAGRLLWAFIPHVDQVPATLRAEGRKKPTDHSKAIFRIEPLRISQTTQEPILPVAALPNYPGEIRTVYRAKKRPVLVIGAGSKQVSKNLRRGYPKWQTNPTILVAPYYGIESTNGRGGWPKELVKRIRRCEYPQYFWDMLPVSGSSEGSVLRLDQLQPIGRHNDSLKWTKFCLNEEAMELLKEQITWLLWGELPKDSLFLEMREELLAL